MKLTREQILAMKPEELARLTAVHIMEWIEVEKPNGGKVWVTEWHDEGTISNYIEYPDWNPGENISAAWEVLERMRETHKRKFTNEMYAIMNPNFDSFQIAGIDLIWHMNPLNICKAALLAVMEEETR